MSAKLEKSNIFAKSVFSLTRESLARLRLKARRNGAWFRDLKQNERSLLDLTIKIVKKVRSFTLAKVVFRLVSRLYGALESRIYCLICTEGREMVKKLSRIGEEWGYRAAKNWVADRGFIQYLVVNNLGVLAK